MIAKFTERENVIIISKGTNQYITIYPSYLRGKICEKVFNTIVKSGIAECEVCKNKDCIITKK